MTISRIITLSAVLTLAIAVMPGQARAQRGGGPCRGDIETLCPDITPGPGSFHACLQQHAADLSPECQQHLSEMQAKMAAWRQACGGDVQTLCSDVDPGRGNIIRCLRQHGDELSQACANQLAQHHGHRHGHHGQSCSDSAPGGETSGN